MAGSIARHPVASLPAHVGHLPAFARGQPVDWFARHWRVREALAAAPYFGRVEIERTRVFSGELGLDAIVAVPIRNEEERLTGCLDALAASIRHAELRCGVVLVINNTSDRSADVAADWACAAAIPALVCEVALPGEIAHVGYARRLALDIAAGVGGHDAVLLSSDADTAVGPSWVGDLVAAVRSGAQLVATRIDVDRVELDRLPSKVRAAGEAESRLKALHHELWERLLPGEPCALLLSAGGASFAVASRAYRSVDGLPPLAVQEDRALVRAILLGGGDVRLHESAFVTTSCRLDARAAGGMADALVARCTLEDPDLDPLLTTTPLFVTRAIAWRLSALRSCKASRSLGVRVEGLLRGFGIDWSFEQRHEARERAHLLQCDACARLTMTKWRREAAHALRLLSELEAPAGARDDFFDVAERALDAAGLAR